MTCGDARDLLSRELDGRLPDADRDTLEMHLSQCGGCRAERQLWRSLSRALRAHGPTPVPAGLAERCVEAALHAPPAPAPTLAAWFVAAARPALLAGAATAVAVWLTAGALGPHAPPAPRDTVQDPMELAMQLWTTEGGADAP